ncbi:MAG: hypothetical protein JRC92_08405 [Deltaproteobacteria bacterium]|nr:hypothetical protein [Deltaproteobacteria bacterium]
MKGFQGRIGLAALLGLIFMAGCVQAGEHQEGQPQNGLCTSHYPDGSKAQEAVFVNGQLEGPYSLWYKSGSQKFSGRFVDGRLDGRCAAWFENGKKRLSIAFDQGRPDSEWVRYHEKAGAVARLNFAHGRLEGSLTTVVNRGTGEGHGTSYEMRANFENGRLVGPFEIKDTDASGWAVIIVGKVLEGGELRLERASNLHLDANGKIWVDYGGSVRSYQSIQDFIMYNFDHRILPMFTLDFCSISIESGRITERQK